MKITENFVVVIDKLKYTKFENQNKFTKENEPEVFTCNAVVYEVGRGMARYKQFHQVVFYLTEQEYNEQVIEKGDRINILAGAKWKSSLLQYKSYNKETIEKANKTYLKVDDKGKVYYSEYVYAYKIHAEKGMWSINCKIWDQNYCTIKESGVKLPLENKSHFNETSLDWIIEDDEFEKLKQYATQSVTVIAYSNKAKFAEKNMQCTIKILPENNTKYLLLEKSAGE